MPRRGTRNGLPKVRQSTRELKRRIRESVARKAPGAGTRAVLVAEQGVPAWPVRLLGAPLLQPVDKIVWMVLRQNVSRGRFPSHARIGRAANISSTSTVSRALAILRATRWLARCGENGAGGARIEVYALPDAPLPLPDAVHLDGEYPAFLQFAQAHPHARVRYVAREVLASLDGTVDERILLSGIARRRR